jgi:predicted  nucleic acid-binding Zn-ribbon protein
VDALVDLVIGFLIAAAVLFALIAGWQLNCLGLHSWDKSGSITDTCRHCGAKRFKYMASDRAEALKMVKLADEYCVSGNVPSAVRLLCGALRILCDKTLDDVERCGCSANYPKGSCPECTG